MKKSFITLGPGFRSLFALFHHRLSDHSTDGVGDHYADRTRVCTLEPH